MGSGWFLEKIQSENELGWTREGWRAKTRPGADCGSDHELLIAKFRLELKKVPRPEQPLGRGSALSRLGAFSLLSSI